MVNPSLDTLMNHVDSKYTLVTMASKRARELMNNNELSENEKAVTAALKDIVSGNVTYERVKSALK
jgi:DNA-directed RNA polymerase, omega subunit